MSKLARAASISRGPRVAAVLALLILEILLLGITFDAETLKSLPPTWWVHGLALMPQVVRGALAVLIAGLVLGRSSLSEWVTAESVPRAPFLEASFLTLHLLSFAALVVLMNLVLGEGVARRSHLSWWIATWFVTAGVAGAFAVAAVFPLTRLPRLLGRGAGLIAAAAVLGLFAWSMGQYTQTWWKGLRHVTLVCAYWVIRRFDASAVVDWPNDLLGTSRFLVEISTPCCGYEGVGLVWVFLATYLWHFRDRLRFPQALVLIPLATLAVLAANVLRIAALVIVGDRLSPQVALGGFHSYAGTLLFAGVALGTAEMSRRVRYISAERAVAAVRSYNPAAPWLVPFLAVLATALLAGLFLPPGPDPLYLVRIAVGAVALWTFRAAYCEFDWTISVAAAAMGALVFVAWVVLPPTPHVTDHEAAIWTGFGMPWLLLRGLGYVVVVPFVEELAFRGYLARRLTARCFSDVPQAQISALAILVSAVVFGLLHSRFFAGCLAGLVYGWASRRRGRISDAIVAHAATNLLLTVYVLLTQRWGLWN